MELKFMFTIEEKLSLLSRNGYEIKYTEYDEKERAEVWHNNELVFFHWNKRDFIKYDQVNDIFTKLIKDKLLSI